jgi:hypothetical protein
MLGSADGYDRHNEILAHLSAQTPREIERARLLQAFGALDEARRR